MIVQAPDGKTIDFAELPSDQVTAAMKKLYPPKEPLPGVGEDMVRGGASGLAEGAIGLATAPLDIGADVGGYLAKKAVGNSTLGIEQNSLAGKALDYTFGKDGLNAPSEMPNVGNKISKGLGLDYEPKTDPGKIAKGVGEFAPAMVGGASLAKKGVQKIGEYFPKSVIPNADELRTIGGGLYDGLDKIGGRMKPEIADKFVEQIQKMKPQTEMGKAYAGENDFTKSVDRLAAAMKGKSISLGEAQELDELLGEEIDKFIENGVPTKQGKKLLDIQTSLRNMITESPEDHFVGGKEGFEQLSKARQVWAASRRVADIEKIMTRAELSPNPDNAIRSGFRALYTNQARMRGFSAEEKEAIKKAAESGIVGDLIGMVGSRLNPIISYASGAGLGADAAVAGASMAARGARTAVAVGRAKNAANMVSKNAMNKAGIPLKTKPRFGGGDEE